MTVAAGSAVAVALLALAAVLVYLRPSDRLLQDHLLTRYVVTIASGETFDGLLAAVDTRTLVLRDVGVLKVDGGLTPVDGDVVLRRDAVSYMQRPR